MARRPRFPQKDQNSGGSTSTNRPSQATVLPCRSTLPNPGSSRRLETAERQSGHLEILALTEFQSHPSRSLLPPFQPRTLRRTAKVANLRDSDRTRIRLPVTQIRIGAMPHLPPYHETSQRTSVPLRVSLSVGAYHSHAAAHSEKQWQWDTLRAEFNAHSRVTNVYQRIDGTTLHVRHNLSPTPDQN